MKVAKNVSESLGTTLRNRIGKDSDGLGRMTGEGENVHEDMTIAQSCLVSQTKLTFIRVRAKRQTDG